MSLLPVACSTPTFSTQPNKAALLSGPMLADLRPDGVRLWAEARQAATYEIQVRNLDRNGPWLPAQGPLGKASLDLRGSEGRGSCQLTGLAADTAYAYRLVPKVGRALPDLHGQYFHTPAADGQAYDFRVAFGSCAGEWGMDASQPVFTAIDTKHPDLFLWLGDNVYFIHPDREWENPELMEKRWRHSRAKASLQPLLNHTAHYAIWDDHDYGPDNSDRSYALRKVSKSLFNRYWANPASGQSENDGIYFSFTFGRVEFFMLDTRYERAPNERPESPEKVILSDVQWQWLEQGLKNSKADFKVVASGMQILSDYHRFETWNLFPSQRARLLDFIREQRISGVFFLSGDRHIGEALREPNGGYDLVEFTSSPLAAGIGETLPDRQVPQRIAGTLAAVENFGLLDFRFPAPGSSDFAEGPALTFRLYDVYGKPLGRQVVLRLSELQP
ncbi:MAG: alkaline phosphatase D family protein [Planctomycetota bacterium]|nr:alkaline phosphatase D family protein [Planctomycetota bacterium]